jgi:uncharacterized protein
LFKLEKLNNRKNKVIIAGGSGYIGRRLAKYLSDEGYLVSILGRNKSPETLYPWFYWNPTEGYIDPEALKNKNIIINLSGAGLADKIWTKKRKKELFASRLLSTRLIFETVKNQKLRPDTLISASAIGFYGSRPSETLTESSMPGTSYLSGLCKAWENEAINNSVEGAKLIILRIGVTIDMDSGLIKNLKKAIRGGLNIVPGNGNQLISWIHTSDLCRSIEFLIENKDSRGIFNCVSPGAVSMKALQGILVKNLDKKCLTLNLPSRLLKLLLGSFSELFLSDQHVIPEKLVKSGFEFMYPTIDSALR